MSPLLLIETIISAEAVTLAIMRSRLYEASTREDKGNHHPKGRKRRQRHPNDHENDCEDESNAHGSKNRVGFVGHDQHFGLVGLPHAHTIRDEAGCPTALLDQDAIADLDTLDVDTDLNHAAPTRLIGLRAALDDDARSGLVLEVGRGGIIREDEEDPLVDGCKHVVIIYGKVIGQLELL